MRSHRIILSLSVLLGIRILIMATTPVFEPSEARYAAISANMARNGDWFVPSFTYEGTYQRFAGKPPLVFQAAAACCRVLGVNELAVRLVPFLSFLLLLVIVYYAVSVGASRRGALLATGLCATSVALYATVGFCMTDSSLVCCVAGALLLYWRLVGLEGRKPRLFTSLAICALLGVGTLVKGPVALALFGLPVLSDAVINRRWKTLLSTNWFWGAVLFLFITVPYFCAVETYQPGFLRYFFINENVMRFLVRDYGDKYGAGRETFRGMAAIWALVVTLPWSLFVIFRRPSDWRRTRPFGSFLLLSVIVITLFWCLTSRVPIAYLLPVVPLFAAYLSTEGWKLGISRHALSRFMPWAAAGAVLVLSAVIAAVWICNPKKMPGRAAGPKVSDHYFSYEFYHAPWGKGAPKR